MGPEEDRITESPQIPCGRRVGTSDFGPAVAPSRPCGDGSFVVAKCREVSFAALPDRDPSVSVSEPLRSSSSFGPTPRDLAGERASLELVTPRPRVSSQSLKPGQD